MISAGPPLARLIALAWLGAALGCAGADDSGSTPPPSTFIALNRDFADFRSWPKLQVGDAANEQPHVHGPRFVYVNKLPPHGSTEFPIGTIIVKTVETDGQVASSHIHASVKRGGGFNPEGAKEWEWLELVLLQSGVPVIAWRGENAPFGEGYQALPGEVASVVVDCNGCHVEAAANDYVKSAALELATF